MAEEKEKEKEQLSMWSFFDKNKYLLLAVPSTLFLIVLFKGHTIETSFFKIGKIPDTIVIEKEVINPSDTIYQQREIKIEEGIVISK